MRYVESAGNKSLYLLAKNLLLAASTITLAGCGSMGAIMEKMPWHSSDPVDYSLISTNLVDAMSQYPVLGPSLSTIQVIKPDSQFAQQVHEKLTERGFKLERVAKTRGANGVSATVHRDDVDSIRSAPLYVLSVGGISAERRFDSVDGKTIPLSELVFRGVNQRDVTLNDAELFGEVDSNFSTVAFIPEEAADIAAVLRPSAEKLPSSSVNNDGRQAFVKKNIYDTMTSNFSGLYSEYEDVEQKILVFPNDSLRLGETNKKIIEDYVEMIDTSTDVLSVIGCSHGTTEINNGNSLLALGRANRVKEAFLFSGVEHDMVLEEGCWAPETFNGVMPDRGVVLTLKRRKPS
ncbi:MAG: hypothetical protein AB8B87_19145 [Granulosicoccus sp.]